MYVNMVNMMLFCVYIRQYLIISLPSNVDNVEDVSLYICVVLNVNAKRCIK